MTTESTSTDTYRAAVWYSQDCMTSIPLTGLEHSHLSDEELFDIAHGVVKKIGLEYRGGFIEITYILSLF